MVEIISGQHIQIKREAAAVVHLDGEPVEMDNFIEIDIIPLALKIITN
jgi:diacylglycerol kinase family enzyme